MNAVLMWILRFMIGAFRGLDEWVLDDPDRGVAMLAGSFAFESCG
jgi:hypothetical protein